MRVTRLVLVALLLALLPLASCGSGKKDTFAGISFGATYYVIPYLDPLFETELLGFKNLSAKDTDIEVTAFTPGGIATGPFPIEIPGNGEVRAPVGDFLGGAPAAHVGGWIVVDTTPGPAVGLVAGYVDRSNSLNRSAELGGTFRAGPIAQSLSEFAQSYQIVNHSEDVGATPIGITYDVTVYDAFGGVVSMTEEDVPANGAVTIPVPSPGFVGQVCVDPKELITGLPFASTETLRTFVSALEVDSAVLTEAHLLRAADTSSTVRTVGFDIDYGFDSGNNAHDFALVVSNPTDDGQVVTLDSIFTAAGVEILGSPRQILLDPHQTKFFRERTVDSIGLDDGEVSPFDDLFPDLDTQPPFNQYVFAFTIPADVNASMRHYDSVFDSFFRILNGSPKLSNRVNVANVPTQTATLSGTRTFIDIGNPFGNTVDVFPNVTTPGGTVYVLDPVSIPARERVRFSTDGMVFREDPFDATEPPVPFIAVELSAVGGLFFNSRTTTRNAQDVILFMRPGIVRNETFE